MTNQTTEKQMPKLFEGVVVVTAAITATLFVYFLLIQQTDQIEVDAEFSRAYASEMQAIRAEADRKHYFEN